MGKPKADITIASTESETKEYSLLIEGVVECPASKDRKMFFDGLLDTIIEYVEKHEAIAGLGMSYRPYHAQEGDSK
jgi:predicted RNA binding protein YcfA (HicA-like mRNA interferase family)